VAHNTLQWLSFKLQVPIEELEALVANAEQHYRPYWKTFPNGKQRYIEWPDDRLMHVQQRIRSELLLPVPLSPIVHGCVKGRSNLTNASGLVKSPSLGSADVKHFFPSVTNKMVYRAYVEFVGVGPDLARILTLLTTRSGHLPQGAPTSDALGNIALTPVDREVEKIAKALDLRPRRYVDNYDFAGARAREAIEPTIRALRNFGLAVRHKKTFNAGPRSAHIATGYAVNSSRPSVARNARDFARNQVYELIRQRRRGADTKKLERSLRGRLIHLSRTNGGFVVRMKRELDLG